MFDVLIIGNGPAGTAVAAALNNVGLRVGGLSPTPAAAPWPNTYGIWRDELDAPHLNPDWLGRLWTDCTVNMGGGEIALQRTYGLFDNDRLQADLLADCTRGGMVWEQGLAADVRHLASHSEVTTRDGRSFHARLVIDASGHRPVFATRPHKADVAMQAAYGIIGRFSQPPVRPNQMMLMDYRADHLTPAQRQQPPTFLYAMDFGDGVYFVEETSLAYYPAIPYDTLEQRLHQRLGYHGIQVEAVDHVEYCLFPMNLPLPDLRQPLFAYGGAASMVHPATGYQVGAALTHAPAVAQAIAAALGKEGAGRETAVAAAWRTLWSTQNTRKRALYLFGLANILRFNHAQTQRFFTTFFELPPAQWQGYLSNTLTTAELLQTMWRLFTTAPGDVRCSLTASVGSEGRLLWQALRPLS